MLTRAAVAKAQEDTEGGGTDDDAEGIDEAIMDLQVGIKQYVVCPVAPCPPCARVDRWRGGGMSRILIRLGAGLPPLPPPPPTLTAD